MDRNEPDDPRASNARSPNMYSGGPRIRRLCIQKFKTQKQNSYFILLISMYTFDYTLKYYKLAKNNRY